MRIEHDVVARPLGDGEWLVRCFTCPFRDDVDLDRKSAFRVRREHIEANTAPPGMEPELPGGDMYADFDGCRDCGWGTHTTAECPNRP